MTDTKNCEMTYSEEHCLKGVLGFVLICMIVYIISWNAIKADKATSSFSSLQDTLFTLGEKIKSFYESQEIRNVNSSNISYSDYLEPDYTCSYRHCYWSNYKKDEDWGYYSRTNGDCSFCQDKCTKDATCGGVECGNKVNYCSWWKIGKCSTAQEKSSEHNRHKTCMKN